MIEKEPHFQSTGLEIAVIGMVGRFPGAKNIQEFWKNLTIGSESITFFAEKELDHPEVAPQMWNSPLYIKAYGWLTGIEFFDSSFFGYSPLESEIMDPQMCIFHECACEALEDAGYDADTYNELIGLYAGASGSFLWQVRPVISARNTILGLFPSEQLYDKDYLATRVAHKLNLRGPAVTVDTACSTSLVVIHMACQGLLSGDCDIALAGGVSIRVLDKKGYLYEQGMLHSPDGHCRAFDAKAKGCNFGNGVGIVVLKRLAEAIADGDTIHAVIKGSSTNNDGAGKAGYTAPSSEGQAQVIRTALEMAEVEPETITYVETHGTATALGDPVEIEGLKSAFDSEKKHFCRIGSVKTNVGHLNEASGMAGFIKTVLALKYQLIPPSLHFETPNPKIDFENSPFVVNTGLTPWERGEYPRRAGVSSFGIGGTNAHAVLEEAPIAQSAERKAQSAGREYQLILLSAKTPSALDKMTINLVNFLKENRGNPANPTHPGPTLADIAYTLQVGRHIHQYRRMLVCRDVPEAVQLLSTPDSGKVKTVYSREDNRPIVFMFSGLGSQYVNMGRDLYENEPVFRREMDRGFEILNGLLDYDIKEILYPHSDCRGGSPCPPQDYSGSPGQGDHRGSPLQSDQIHQPEIAQIVIFIFEYAMVQLLMSWGIRPYAMIGYSFGEYTAACAAGVFSLEDALKLVVSRGRLIQQAPEGAMLSVPLSREAIAPYLNQEVSLAIDNGPSCIVSGPAAAVDAFEKQMKDNRLVCMRVPVGRALHSPAMTPVLQEFTAILDTIQFNQPQIPYISNLSGDWAARHEVVLPRYWTTHLISTVRFADGMKVLLKEPNSIFVEIGPGRDISALTQRHIEDSANQGGLVLNLVKQSHQETADVYLMLNRLGILWLHGQSINWDGFYGEEKRQRIPLPTYPFEGQRCWIDKGAINIKEIVGKRSDGVGTRQPPDFVHWFYMPSWSRLTLLRPVHQEVSQQLKPNCLVFLDDCGIGLRLVKRLKQEGHHVITVEAGIEFLKKSAEVYVICPQQPRHYSRLLDELRSREALPRRIVHLWGVTPEGMAQVPEEEFWNENKISQYSYTVGPGEQCPDWSESVQDKGFYSLIHLAKVIGQLTITPTMNEPLHIAVVTNQMQEVTGDERLCPAKATVIGPVKVIPQELPGVCCRSIDVVLPGPGGQQEKKIVQQLLEEISTTSVDTEIAYRGNFRWVRTYKPIRLEVSGKKTTKLREGGVYLVTGGLGKIGFLLARYLAKRVKAKLVLTGRSAFPSRETWDQWLADHGNENPIGEKIKQMKEQEESGAQFRVFSADAADKEKMQTVIDHTIQEWGTINGVIHGAGIMNPGSFRGFQELTRSSCQEHFRSKVEGSLNLGELLQDQPLDFVLFLSSISTVLGGVHFTAYAAANCFMDALARKYNRLNSSRWISVDWDGMEEEKTWDAFWWILSLDNLDQVVASNGGNLQQRIDQWVKLESLGEDDQAVKEKSKKRQSRPNLLSTYVPPGTGTEQVLVEAWQRLFGLEPVGIEDDFIELGGDSLKAIMMINQVHKKLNVTVPLVEFFKNPTIKWLARYTRRARIDVFQSITPVEKREYYPLSSAQKRLYILHKMNPAALGYNLAAKMLLAGKCDMVRLEYSFRRLIQRHESLRASFHLIDGETVQQIHDEVGFEIEYYQDKVEEIIREFIRPFDLSRAPLMRVALIKIAADEHILVVDMHHIIHDGISQTILFKEFVAVYRREELPGLKLQYKDYAGWQNQNIKKEAVKKQELYWLRQFPGEIPVLNLPYDFPRPVIQSFDGSTAAFEIDKKETKALKTLVRSENVTLFMALLSIYYVFLSKLSGQEDIVIGTPEAGRKHPDLQPIIGFFLNTLPLRNYPCPDKSFCDFLKEVKERTLETFENQDYPFEDLVERVVVNRDLTRSPLFDMMFILHTQWASRSGEVLEVPERDAKGLTFKSDYYEKNTSEFDLTLIGFDEGDRILFKFEYCTRLFKEETIRRFIVYFETILSAVLGNPGQRMKEIGIIPGSEKSRLLHDFNDTAIEYPLDKTIHELFEQQVERTPDHIALIGQIPKGVAPPAYKKSQIPNQQVTYKELNQRSHRLACLLRAKGVGPGTIVGILVRRTPAMMVGLLGILNAGGAYLPLDPEYPEARIKYIIEKSSANILLTQENLINKYQNINFEGEVIDIFDESLYRRTSSRKAKRFPLDPAYVIYTSGSAGNPKGVVITHQNAVNFITGMTTIIDFSPGKTIVALTTISFDIFFLETLLPVTCGLKVVIADENRQKDPRLLGELITRNNVRMVQVTPSRLQTMAHLDTDFTSWEGVEALIVGGEAFPVHLFEGVKEKFPGKIYNVYGPTETTIWSTVKDLSLCGPEELTIGTPIANTQIYIVDKRLGIQPLGAAGELLIGGDGVASGYLNNPELTAEKFIEQVTGAGDRCRWKYPNSNKKPLRGVQISAVRKAPCAMRLSPGRQRPKIYKTGDLARWLPDGNVEFLGRLDHQVKIRGFRIELEEIEEQLLKQEIIKEAVVVTNVNNTGEKYLCAYVVPNSERKVNHEINVSELRNILLHQLPHYMIPSYFVVLEQIPLTPNGKLDRKALPKPKGSLVHSSMYVAPGTSNEKIIADLWKEVLQVEKVGIHDNFFDLGGNSLNVIQLNQRLVQSFGKEMPVAMMFRNLTIRFLDQYFNEDNTDQADKNLAEVIKRTEAFEKAKNTFKDTISKFRGG